ncbi:hypothetical protein M404DRAFT_992744 [Pisolithus tinctorius Marx 270]|uniref:Fido domain-containing protein n=1 Tax=Pisolithus tinctorius Marx 270 TaxID=870435 RepID=A0A0C3PV67_PISTI|nr:hypothetical protein M404DRAFT_992744 [Pisolithus tinctorius Marx 270]
MDRKVEKPVSNCDLVFVRCHPFEDGNGRLARLLASIPLMEDGYSPMFISLGQRAAY